MSPTLKHLIVNDFRSIRGEASLSLDAPVVLVHGPNGAGKTSLMAAIELALTGEVSSLRRADSGYVKHLLHREAEQGRVRLDVAGLPGTGDVNLTVGPEGLAGGHLLEGDLARFYAERCYLSQATLGRLLEVYEAKEGKGPTALSRFVKDLLGLDRLDALVDGLKSVGDVRRLREPLPGFWAARDEVPKLREELAAADARVDQAASECERSLEGLRTLLGGLGGSLATMVDEPERLVPALNDAPERKALDSEARLRRDIAAILETWRSLPVLDATSLAEAETEVSAAQGASGEWLEMTGKALDLLLDEARQFLPIVPTVESSSWQRAAKVASEGVANEFRLYSDMVKRDEADDAARLRFHSEVQRCRERIVALDRALEDSVGTTHELVRALAQVAQHVHDENCPVCGRDYGEVSTQPLGSHLSQRIAALTEQAARAESLSKERALTEATLASAERNRDALISRLSNQEQRDTRKGVQARLAELVQEFDKRRAAALDGDALATRVKAANDRLAGLLERDKLANSLREAARIHALRMGEPEPAFSEPTDVLLNRLLAIVEHREVELEKRLANRRGLMMGSGVIERGWRRGQL